MSRSQFSQKFSRFSQKAKLSPRNTLKNTLHMKQAQFFLPPAADTINTVIMVIIAIISCLFMFICCSYCCRYYPHNHYSLLLACGVFINFMQRMFILEKHI